MNLVKDIVCDRCTPDVEQLQAALAVAEDDRDRAQALAEERLRLVDRLRIQLAAKDAELGQLRGEGR